jgi:tetratricopeptide (TPR) repeat protein
MTRSGPQKSTSTYEFGLKKAKSETTRRAARGLLAWFVFLVSGDSLAVRLAEAQSKTDATAQAACTNPSGSLQRDLSGTGFQDLNDAEQHYARGLQLVSSAEIAGAEAEFKAALAEKPKDGRYVRELAYLYIEGKRDDEAIKIIQNYAKLCGETALGYSLAGELLFRRKRFEAARVIIAKSLRLDDQNPRMHELLGLSDLSMSGSEALSQSVSELRKAQEGDPNNAEIRFFYGRVLYTKGRYDEAREQFLACLKLEPNYRKAQENLGLCYEALGDFFKATQSYLMAMKSEEEHAGAKHGEPFGYYGAMLMRLNKREEAVQVLRRGLAASPKSFVVNFELGRVLVALSQVQEGEHYLLTAEQLAPYYPRTYYLLGQIHQKQGRVEEAKQEFAKFEKLNKGAENIGFPLTDRQGEPQ